MLLMVVVVVVVRVVVLVLLSANHGQRLLQGSRGRRLRGWLSSSKPLQLKLPQNSFLLLLALMWHQVCNLLLQLQLMLPCLSSSLQGGRHTCQRRLLFNSCCSCGSSCCCPCRCCRPAIACQLQASRQREDCPSRAACGPIGPGGCYKDRLLLLLDRRQWWRRWLLRNSGQRHARQQTCHHGRGCGVSPTGLQQGSKWAVKVWCWPRCRPFCWACWCGSSWLHPLTHLHPLRQLRHCAAKLLCMQGRGRRPRSCHIGMHKLHLLAWGGRCMHWQRRRRRQLVSAR
jgi:hypothetical protein